MPAELVCFPARSTLENAHATVGKEEGNVWVLRMEGRATPDNRLTPEFIRDSLLPALDYVELTYLNAAASGDKDGKKGALVLTGERGKKKFFSNGLNLECLKEYPSFFKDYYYLLLSRLLTFPIHTVAAINGHCFAGGLCLALACDWRVCRPDRTWLSMNELAFGAPIPDGMASVLQLRLSPPVVRRVLLTAHRYVAEEALAEGIVDEVVKESGSDECLRKAVERAREVAGLAESGVLTAMRRTLYAPTLTALAQDERMKLGEPQRLMGERRAELEAKAKGRAKL
ncbi:hypothetical protein JCM10213_001045 [Rhodosporidiobolus nylandii]